MEVKLTKNELNLIIESIQKAIVNEKIKQNAFKEGAADFVSLQICNSLTNLYDKLLEIFYEEEEEENDDKYW